MRNSRRRWPVGAGLVAALVGCGGEPPSRTASMSLLEGVPVPPGVAPLESTGGPEAVETVYRSGQPADSVAAWYRRWFLAQRWRISGDTRLPDGTVVLYAEHDGRPVWIMVRRAPTGRGSQFSVMGAETGGDSASRP